MSRTIRLADIQNDDRNFNKHTAKGLRLLEDSIKKVGVIESITVTNDDKIISGNARKEKITKVLGNDIEPIVIETDGTKPIILKRTDIQSDTKEFYEAAILANTVAQQNINLNTELIKQVAVQQHDIDVQKLGVTKIDLNEYTDIEEDDYQQDQTTLKTDIQLGDAFLIQCNGLSHRLLCGDATNNEHVKYLMQNKTADMVFIDPPYNVRVKDIIRHTKQREFVQASGEMTEEQFIDFLTKATKNLKEYTKSGSIHYICMDWKHVYELITAARQNYSELKNICVWKKDLQGLGCFYRSMHELIFVFKNDRQQEHFIRNSHELVFVYKNGKEKHTNNFLLGETGRTRNNVWEYARSNSFATLPKDENGKAKKSEELKLHPTVKPIKLVADAILDCSNKGQIILDTFGGSGTTMLAAQQTGRHCYMMELDEKYCQTIINRFKAKFNNETIKKMN